MLTSIKYILSQKLVSVHNTENVPIFADINFSLITVADLFHLYTRVITEMRKPESGIYTLEQALLKLQESPSQLTTLHADLCLLCLLSKNFKPGLQVLNIDVTSISKEVSVVITTRVSRLEINVENFSGWTEL